MKREVLNLGAISQYEAMSSDNDQAGIFFRLGWGKLFYLLSELLRIGNPGIVGESLKFVGKSEKI